MRNSSTIKVILANRRANCAARIPSVTTAGSANAASSSPSSSTASATRSRRFHTGTNTTIGKNDLYQNHNLSFFKHCTGMTNTIPNHYYSTTKIRTFSSNEQQQQQQEEEYVFKHAKSQEIFQKLSQLQLEEVQTVVDLMYDKLDMEITEADKLRAKGGSAALAAASSSNNGGDGAAAEEEQEAKTHFDLKLSGFDAKSKIKVIKEVRAISGLGLKEAKALVEGAPKVVKKDLKLEEAEELKKKLEAVGATVELD